MVSLMAGIYNYFIELEISKIFLFLINFSSRTDLQANDLNRQWCSPSINLHPTIYHTKMLLRCLNTFSNGRNPVAFIDLHGHSRYFNIFSYSCFPMVSWKKVDRQNFQKCVNQKHYCPCNETNSCKLVDQIALFEEKQSIQSNFYFRCPPFAVLPFLLLYQSAPTFDIENCSFFVQKDREQTARIVAWRQFDVPLVYTFECSSAGLDKGPYAGQSLSHQQLEEMGQYMVKCFNLIEFIFCSEKHFPLMICPNNSTTNLNLATIK